MTINMIIFLIIVARAQRKHETIGTAKTELPAIILHFSSPAPPPPRQIKYLVTVADLTK